MLHCALMPAVITAYFSLQSRAIPWWPSSNAVSGSAHAAFTSVVLCALFLQSPQICTPIVCQAHLPHAVKVHHTPLFKHPETVNDDKDQITNKPLKTQNHEILTTFSFIVFRISISMLAKQSIIKNKSLLP